MFTDNKKSYPQQYSDTEILKVIEQNSAKLKQNLMAHSGIVGPSWFNSIIDLGYNELNKRHQDRFLQQVNRLNVENEKSGRINFRLNIITITLAIVSIILSVITLLKG